jgi:hypothetical protein
MWSKVNFINHSISNPSNGCAVSKSAGKKDKKIIDKKIEKKKVKKIIEKIGKEISGLGHVAAHFESLNDS